MCEKYGFERVKLLQCDTDGITYDLTALTDEEYKECLNNIKPDEVFSNHFTDEHLSKLGIWEADEYDGYNIVTPKTYILKNGDNYKITSKGIKDKYQVVLDWDTLDMADEIVESKWIRNKDKTIKVIPESKKHPRNNITKGKLEKDSIIYPLTL